MSRSAILWQNGLPCLLCVPVGKGKWEVVNGGWTLLMKVGSLEGTVERTGVVLKFDRITEAPDGEDYNDILEKAQQNDN